MKITLMTLSNLLSWRLDIPISLPLSHVDFFGVQTCLSPLQSQLNQILVKLPFLLTCGLIFFVILMTLERLLEGLSYEHSSEGHLASGRTNHSTSLWICLYIHCKAHSMIYMCRDYLRLVKGEIKSSDELQIPKAPGKCRHHTWKVRLLKWRLSNI